MARLTRHAAAVRIAELQRAVHRLTVTVDQQPHGNNARRYDEHRRQLANGMRHELETVERLVNELASGLQAVHAEPELAGPVDTSAGALAAALPKASGNRAKVLAAHQSWDKHHRPYRYPGATDVEISQTAGLPLNTIRPRRGELVAQGWLEDGGQRRNHNGRPHIVWQLTDAARQRLQTQEETDT